MKVVAIIQARLNNTRLPKKVLMKMKGESMLSRVCKAARGAVGVDKVVVAWAHHYPYLNENNVLWRYRIVATRVSADVVIRLTSDCPLLESHHIEEALDTFKLKGLDYYSNHQDGTDVQVFKASFLNSEFTHPEHVIADFTTVSKGYSVNTMEDFKRVEALCKEKYLPLQVVQVPLVKPLCRSV